MHTTSTIPRCMLIGLSYPRDTTDDLVADFEEVESLVDTYGGSVVSAIVQNSTRSDYDTFIGHGKVEEVIEIIEKEEIDIVIINVAIKPGQLHTLQLAFEKANPQIKVWDRISLILEIFSKHAKTAEAKLQIKFAKMRQMGPRIYGMGMEMSNQAAGIGAKGVGESNTELMLRHWRNEKGKIQKELLALSRRREEQIQHRKRAGIPTISLVGYTNAGKTSLFNTITKETDYAANKLFATLDSTINKFYLHQAQKEVYISDTIGFIKDLPLELIEAFKSTLLESIHADIILHIIDASDPKMYEKIKTVEDILYELKIDPKKVIYVFNKIDQAESLDQEYITTMFKNFSPQFISVKKSEGLTTLMSLFAEKLKTNQSNT